jgi:hypothetical protein
MPIQVRFNRPTRFDVETCIIEPPSSTNFLLATEKILKQLPTDLGDFRIDLAVEIFNRILEAKDGILDLSAGKSTGGTKPKDTPTTIKTRDGSTSAELFEFDRLPTSVFSDGWSPEILPRKDHPGDWAHGVCKWVDLPVSKKSTSGGALVYLVRWPDDAGFTVLVEVSHEEDKFLKQGVSEAFDLLFRLGHQPLELLDTGEQVLSSFVDVETAGAAQFAVSVTREFLQRRYAGIKNQHLISLVPLFTKSKAVPGKRSGVTKPLWQLVVDDENLRVYKEFHRTAPHQVMLPPLFEDATEQKRMEWDEVPVNAKKRIRDATGAALLARPELTTAMETESEFVFALADDPVLAADEALLAALRALDAMAVEEWNEKTTPEMTPSQLQESLLRAWLGEELYAGGSWKIERKRKYEVLDAQGKLTAHAREEFEAHPELSGLPEEAFEQGKLTVSAIEAIDSGSLAVPAIVREGLPSKLGRQGVLVDTYLHIGADGVVRERRNFRGAIAAVKGAHVRTGERGEVLIRYNRQVPLVGRIVGGGGVVDERAPALLFENRDVDFADALFVMDGHPEKAKHEATPLAPVLEVESERYRYGFTFTPEGGSARPVIVELSFDVSTGHELKGGERTGRRVISYGFEFGLDHLGAGGAEKTDAPKTTTTTPEKQEPTSVSTGKLVLRAPEIKREVHDRLDLLREDLHTRPAYGVFVALARRVEQKLTEDILGPRELAAKVAGEKAWSMVKFLGEKL